jgi:hypothetical protein
LSEVDITDVEVVTVVALTWPVTFVGIAKVSVLVTSPFAFVATFLFWEGEGDGAALAVAEGIELGLGVGVAVPLATGDGRAVGVGEGVGEIEGVGPGLPPPPVPPPPVPPPPVSDAAIMEKLLVTEVAAAYEVSPLCAAVNEHKPVLVKETTLLVIVQLPEAVIVTVNPEVLEAETVNGPGMVLFVIAAKVIVCKVFVTVNVFVPFAAS